MLNYNMDKHNEEHIYVAIDLKSFYASVECRERGMDALTTNLVVADPTRTEKTICLAVSPALKAYGIPGRESSRFLDRSTSAVPAYRGGRSPEARQHLTAWKADTTISNEISEKSCGWVPNVAFHQLCRRWTNLQLFSAKVLKIQGKRAIISTSFFGRHGVKKCNTAQCMRCCPGSGCRQCGRSFLLFSK